VWDVRDVLDDALPRRPVVDSLGPGDVVDIAAFLQSPRTRSVMDPFIPGREIDLSELHEHFEEVDEEHEGVHEGGPTPSALFPAPVEPFDPDADPFLPNRGPRAAES